MDTFISSSPEETARLGEVRAQQAIAGDIIALSGDLGAGKTQWAKGFARGLGIEARVQSPSFALVNEYAGGRFPLFHLDLYRLETVVEIITAGLEDFLRPEAVVLVEWAERWFEADKTALRKPTLWVRFEVLPGDKRKIVYECARA